MPSPVASFRPLCAWGAGLALAVAADVPIDALMPQPQDYGLVTWAEGWPPLAPGAGAGWIRAVHTGRYAFVMDTAALRVLHCGALPAAPPWDEAAGSGPALWSALPPAQLTIEVMADGATYRLDGAKPWRSNGSGPRLIGSGRLVQHLDINGLTGRAQDGRELPGDAALELVAWPDRLALVLAVRPAAAWSSAALHLALQMGGAPLACSWSQPPGEVWPAGERRTLVLSVDPAAGSSLPAVDPCQVEAAAEVPVPVRAAPELGGHLIDLDALQPTPPPGGTRQRDDGLERVRLRLRNPTAHEQVAHLVFARRNSRFPVTGVSAMLRDAAGEPTGIPVQISKNWHGSKKQAHGGLWLNAFAQVRLPPGAEVPLELAVAYGHWGGVPAASYAQLCLIGWGHHQQWDESALGCWGETQCAEPDRVQARSLVTDVRPQLVRGMKDKEWDWTHNVGGGDAIRVFDPAGMLLLPAGVRTVPELTGPCLTAVTYTGRIADAVDQAITIGLVRSADIVRVAWRVRMRVDRPLDISRLVLMQIGCDTYSYTAEGAIAVGDGPRLLRQWRTEPGGNIERGEPIELTGAEPWIALTDARRHPNSPHGGAWAVRGLALRSWSARLGGKPCAPWLVERGTTIGSFATTTVDLVPPPGVRRLEPGDELDMTIEHLILPERATDYRGPDVALREALAADGNTWRMVAREAAMGRHHATVAQGTLLATHPAVVVAADDAAAAFTVSGGLGHVPVRITGLPAPSGWALAIDGVPLDQAVHGSDFWQTDYDPRQRTWSLTWNLPAAAQPRRCELRRR